MQHESFYHVGLELAQQKKYPEARAAFREAWRQDPSDPAPLLASAQLERSLNDLAAAHGVLAEALEKHPSHSALNLALGELFHHSGQLNYAIQYYRQSLQADPDQAAAWLQLGRLLLELNQTEGAYEAYQEAVTRQPEMAEAHYLIGLWHYHRAEHQAARQALAEACRLKPQANYYLSLGLATLLPPTDAPAALTALRQAVGMDPDLAENLLHIGLFFVHRQHYHLAWPFLVEAQQVELPPEMRFQLHLYQAQCAEQLCEMQLALDHWQAALELYPERWFVKLAAQLTMPMLYRNATEQAIWFQRLQQHLGSLQGFATESLPRVNAPLQFNLPFVQLACQAQNPRPLLEQLTTLCQRLIRLPQRDSMVAVPGRRRIGLVTAWLEHPHFVGIYQPLVQALAERGSRCLLFSLRQLPVERQNYWAQWADLQPISAQSLEQIAEHFLAAELDLLIYPVLGQDASQILLAQARFAPIQLALYGHPVTSASAGIDYFVAPACMAGEPTDYTEQLLALPGLPYRPPPIEASALPFQRRRAELPAEAHLYLIPGELFQISLLMDPVIAEILASDPLARMLFFKSSNPAWEALFKQRLEGLLSASQLVRVHVIDAETPAEQWAVVQDADLVLDTLPVNQFYWVYQAMQEGVPVLTCAGQQLRNRQSAGLYELLGLPELIAESPETMAKQALALVADVAGRQRLKYRLQQAATQRLQQVPVEAGRWAECLLALLP